MKNIRKGYPNKIECNPYVTCEWHVRQSLLDEFSIKCNFPLWRLYLVRKSIKSTQSLFFKLQYSHKIRYLRISRVFVVKTTTINSLLKVTYILFTVVFAPIYTGYLHELRINLHIYFSDVAFAKLPKYII